MPDAASHHSLIPWPTSGCVLTVASLGFLATCLAMFCCPRGARAPRGQQNIARQVARKPSEATVNTQPEVGQGIKL